MSRRGLLLWIKMGTTRHLKLLYMGFLACICCIRLEVVNCKEHICHHSLDHSSLEAKDFWLYFRENACYFIPNESLTFQGAQNRCKEIGSNLVSIADQSENDFITDVLVRSCWISRNRPCTVWLGLDMSLNNSCTWFDNTKYSWHNWPSQTGNQCSNLYSSTICPIFSSNGIWNIRICQQTMKFICKWQPKESSDSKRLQPNSYTVFYLMFLIIMWNSMFAHTWVAPRGKVP